MKTSNKDLTILMTVYESLGKENFIKLYEMMSLRCVDELGIGSCENCKRDMLDNPDEVCIKCICNALDNL